MNEKQILNMAFCLFTQIRFMQENELKGWIQLNPDYIAIINDSLFVYTNADDLYNLEDSNTLVDITSPFLLSDFAAPEIKDLQHVPARVSFNVCLYSLGLILSEFYEGFSQKTPVTLCIERLLSQRFLLYL